MCVQQSLMIPLHVCPTVSDDTPSCVSNSLWWYPFMCVQQSLMIPLHVRPTVSDDTPSCVSNSLWWHPFVCVQQSPMEYSFVCVHQSPTDSFMCVQQSPRMHSFVFVLVSNDALLHLSLHSDGTLLGGGGVHLFLTMHLVLPGRLPTPTLRPPAAEIC